MFLENRACPVSRNMFQQHVKHETFAIHMGNMLCNTDVVQHVAQHIPTCMAGFRGTLLINVHELIAHCLAESPSAAEQQCARTALQGVYL